MPPPKQKLIKKRPNLEELINTGAENRNVVNKKRKAIIKRKFNDFKNQTFRTRESIWVMPEIDTNQQVINEVDVETSLAIIKSRYTIFGIISIIAANIRELNIIKAMRIIILILSACSLTYLTSNHINKNWDYVMISVDYFCNYYFLLKGKFIIL